MKFITLFCATLLAALLTTQAHAAEGGLLSLDLNGDGKVNAEDLAVLRDGFGYSWMANFNQALDLDGDGEVDQVDVNIWVDEYGGYPDEPTPSDGVPTTEATAHLDVNRDGFIDDGDLEQIQNSFGYSWQSDYDPVNDLDLDGEVDQVDVNIWRDGYASLQSPGICDDLRYRHRSYAELIEDAQETGAEAASQLAIRLRTECDGSEPFVLVPGDIVYDSDGAISILRDGASHQLTLRLSGIQQIEISDQSIVYSVELFEGRGPVLLQLFPDGHQELLLYPASKAFAVAE